MTAVEIIEIQGRIIELQERLIQKLALCAIQAEQIDREMERINALRHDLQQNSR